MVTGIEWTDATKRCPHLRMVPYHRLTVATQTNPDSYQCADCGAPIDLGGRA